MANLYFIYSVTSIYIPDLGECYHGLNLDM